MSGILPDDYRTASDDDLRSRILAVKKKLGKQLLLLAHHYQRVEIVELSDRVGDSYGLSKLAARANDAEYIVFCGVRFMAEAARTLCSPSQKVYLPNPTAGCPMADMAPLEQVGDAWERISSFLGGESIIPISYMNSSAELKAFTGKNGGLICTSSNADAAFGWAFKRSHRLFFFPDQHLGRNTANKLGIARDLVVTYDFANQDGGLLDTALEDARVILWNGHCYVHTKFTKEHIDRWRARESAVKIVVHPECCEEVVDNADAVGSTSFIVRYVESAPAGSTIAIGTELNLVHRLALNNKDKNIFELSEDACPICSNMFRTTLADLCYTLENLDSVKPVTVADDVIGDARLALERMLEIGG